MPEKMLYEYFLGKEGRHLPEAERKRRQPLLWGSEAQGSGGKELGHGQ